MTEPQSTQEEVRMRRKGRERRNEIREGRNVSINLEFFKILDVQKYYFCRNLQIGFSKHTTSVTFTYHYFISNLYEELTRAAPIRKTASHIIIFHTKNKKELDTIFDELIIIPQKDFYEILKYCFDKKNNFLYIDTNKGYNDMFHKCFNKLQFNSPDIVGLGDI